MVRYLEMKGFSLRQASASIILLAAVVQGAALYFLHHAIEARHWPATDSAWLLGLYAVFLIVPLTVQILAEQGNPRAQIPIVAVIAIAMLYFGWHHGREVVESVVARRDPTEDIFPLALQLAVLWLMVLPFAQSRIATGSWARDYSLLFSMAWRNKLVLAEAALFTGALWLLLFLWQQLFHMVGFDFFRELFREPLFVYPVTSLTFGLALHLIGSVERFTAAILEQMLNVLKWLGLVAGLLLVLFTVALAIKLPGLVFTGTQAIGAAWLLWLIAVLVLLLNAAYRDGKVENPYPGAMARVFRFVMPLMVVIALTAVYALIVRAREYGLTVDRVWAFVVATAALVYSVGYAIAGLGSKEWFGGIARVNVAVALVLIATMTLALTPLLSPYRLSANSQFHKAHDAARALAEDSAFRPGPLRYLRFHAGVYGRDRLNELAQLRDAPGAASIRERAGSVAALQNAWEQSPAIGMEERLAKLFIHPAGRTLDAQLRELLLSDSRADGLAEPARFPQLAGLFVDLNGDQVDEFVLMKSNVGGTAYGRDGGQWQRIGMISTTRGFRPRTSVEELARQGVEVAPPRWNELVLGSNRYRVDPLP